MRELYASRDGPFPVAPGPEDGFQAATVTLRGGLDCTELDFMGHCIERDRDGLDRRIQGSIGQEGSRKGKKPGTISSFSFMTVASRMSTRIRRIALTGKSGYGGMMSSNNHTNNSP
jgi:hypothetical protein